jgi:type VI secretion system ImpB/VipA family protein
VAQRVEPLKAMLDKRAQLADLRSKLASNYKLDQAIQKALGDEDGKGKLKAEIDAEGGENG